jgi:hypothetical protein
MSSSVLLWPFAEEDIREAIAYYESQREGLGIEFENALDALFVRLRSAPLQFRVVHRDVRRALLRQFPVAITSSCELSKLWSSHACIPDGVLGNWHDPYDLCGV